MRFEVGSTKHLLVDLHLLAEFEDIWDLDLYDTVKNGLVGVLRLESVPFGLIAVRDDNTIKIEHSILTRRRNVLFLCCSEDCVKEFDLVLEDLNELYNSSISDVEGAVKVKNIGGTTAIPRRPLSENPDLATGNFSYSPLNSSINL